mmetsp:Transcript_62488/g.166215  ORF Transcript_62488/g.166215 Transcript_62488/m.166215 type:complete len:275 (-) Transcript_62488:358-1182(-)
MQHGLPEDEQLRAEGRRQSHGHEARPAVAPHLVLLRGAVRGGIGCGVTSHVLAGVHADRPAPVASHVCLGHSVRRGSVLQGRVRLVRGYVYALLGADRHALAEREPSHVVERMQRQVVAFNLDLNRWRLCEATILQLPRRDGQQVGHLRVVGRRDAQVRGTSIHHAVASTILAHVQLLAVYPDGHDLHQPVSHVGHDDRRPGQWLEHALRVVPPHCDLVVLAVLALGQVDAKMWAVDLPLANEDVGGTEFRVEREAVQAQAEDAVEKEGLERLR